MRLQGRKHILRITIGGVLRRFAPLGGSNGCGLSHIAAQLHGVPCKDVLEWSDGKYGQARKGSWWMPRSYCTKKAVVSCEKPRGGAHIPRSADSRMG